MSFHPQTPQSPSQCSPATSSDHTNLSSSTLVSSATTLPTPAHSVNGSISQPETIMSDESPHKRKRHLDDVGDREQKKVHVDEFGLSIGELHVDVGEKYLLCQTQHRESLPRTSEDLYEMFNLSDLAAEVAREKPNGEKNALRKTYKGHIKRLGVAGHFDVTKKQEDAPSDFLSMLLVPELEWNVHQVKGREINDGLSEATLSSLGRAFTLSKGPIGKNVWDSSVLGELAPSSGEPTRAAVTGKAAVSTTPSAAPVGITRPKSQLSRGDDPARPKRNIKKRSYGDSSFEGYGEGFPDDEGGYSTGDGEGSQKRRKKSSGNSPPPPPPPYPAVRQHSYGPGMVGA